jgi:hypothetical protein
MSEPRINIYRCEHGCITVTVDVDHGVTPFMMQCRRRSTPERPISPAYLDSDGYCIGSATSSFYPRGVSHQFMPEWEWYKPESADGMSQAEKYHWEKGGLSLRQRTGCSVVMHGEETEK